MEHRPNFCGSTETGDMKSFGTRTVGEVGAHGENIGFAHWDPDGAGPLGRREVPDCQCLRSGGRFPRKRREKVSKSTCAPRQSMISNDESLSPRPAKTKTTRTINGSDDEGDVLFYGREAVQCTTIRAVYLRVLAAIGVLR
jgi:hypothetical protein